MTMTMIMMTTMTTMTKRHSSPEDPLRIIHFRTGGRDGCGIS